MVAGPELWNSIPILEEHLIITPEIWAKKLGGSAGDVAFCLVGFLF